MKSALAELLAGSTGCVHGDPIYRLTEYVVACEPEGRVKFVGQIYPGRKDLRPVPFVITQTEEQMRARLEGNLIGTQYLIGIIPGSVYGTIREDQINFQVSAVNLASGPEESRLPIRIDPRALQGDNTIIVYSGELQDSGLYEGTWAKKGRWGGRAFLRRKKFEMKELELEAKLDQLESRQRLLRLVERMS
tara:strand:- start:201 stop:773 length:573 start_codon:yes stop_codon:yes gene_type:complete